MDDRKASELTKTSLRDLQVALEAARHCNDPASAVTVRLDALEAVRERLIAEGAGRTAEVAWAILIGDAGAILAELEAEAARVAEKQQGVDAVHQLVVAEADGGGSALSVGDWLASVDAWARGRGAP